MLFNPDPNEQTKEFNFSRKSNSCWHPPATLNNNGINKYPHYKQLDIFLDSKIYFKIHDVQKIKSMKALLIIYKSFIRPHLDYGDILYDKPEMKIFKIN